MIFTRFTAGAVAASFALLTQPCWANGDVGDFNFNETTGLINIPAALVAPEWSLQISPQFQGLGRTLSQPGSTAGRGFGDLDDSFSGNDGSFRGIIGLPGRVELSITALHGNINTLVYGAKWLAIPDSEDFPGFAIGVQSVGAHPDVARPHPSHFDTPSYFGVFGHRWDLNDDGMGVELHGGWGTGRLNRGFVGTEFHFDKMFSLIGEYDGTIESAALRIKPDDRWEVMPALQFQSHNQVHVGLSVSYRFGNTGKEDEKPSEEFVSPGGTVQTPAEPSAPVVAPPAQVVEPTPPPVPPVAEPKVRQPPARVPVTVPDF